MRSKLHNPLIQLFTRFECSLSRLLFTLNKDTGQKPFQMITEVSVFQKGLKRNIFIHMWPPDRCVFYLTIIHLIPKTNIDCIQYVFINKMEA